MKKIVFIGPPGCGKSTLAAQVFTRLKEKNYNTELVSEWIRQDIQINGPILSIWEQYRTLLEQRKIEEAIPNIVDWVIVDSGTLTPYFYCCLYTLKANERERLVLADMFKFLIDDLYQKRYDYVFYLSAEKIYKKKKKEILNDGTRFQTEKELNILEDHMRLIFKEIFNLDNVFYLDIPFNKRADAVLKTIITD